MKGGICADDDTHFIILAPFCVEGLQPKCVAPKHAKTPSPCKSQALRTEQGQALTCVPYTALWHVKDMLCELARSHQRSQNSFGTKVPKAYICRDMPDITRLQGRLFLRCAEDPSKGSDHLHLLPPLSMRRVCLGLLRHAVCL